MDEVLISTPNLGPTIKSIMEDTRELLAIESAPVCKTDQALLSWMLSRVFKVSGVSIWSSLNPRLYKLRMLHWIRTSLPHGERFCQSVRGGLNFPTLGARIIFCEHKDTLSQDVDRVTDVVITDAHEMGDDPQLWVVQNATGHVRILGQVGSPTCWFFRLCRKISNNTEASLTMGAGYYKVTIDDAFGAKLIGDKEVARIKAVIPDALFNQIYHCKVEAEADKESSVMSTRRFAAQRLFIRDKAGKIIQFNLNAMQQKYLAMKRLTRMQGKPRKHLLLKYRRGGFTTLEQAENYKTIVTTPNSQVVTLAHNSDSTKRIFRIAHLFHEKDTRALSLKGTQSGSKLEIEALNSLFFVGTAGATGFGRGDTLQRVHGSEVSKWCRGPRQVELVNDLIAGLTEATSHGEVVLETTADGHEWFAHTYKEAKRGGNDWNPIFLPWFMDKTYILPCDPEEIQDTLIDEEKDLIAMHKLTWEQIQWRRAKIRSLKKLFKQEYPEDDETCFLTSGTAFFDSDFVLDLLEKVPETKPKRLAGGYLAEWEAPVKGEKYVIGCDTSEGIAGCDPNGFGILHRDSGRQVAALHGMFKPDKLAAYICEACVRYNDALMGVERNNHGHAVIQKIIDLGKGKSHLHGGTLFYFSKERAGWDTNEQTRPVMLDEVSTALHEGFLTPFDRDFLGECLTFKLQSSGKFEADPGCHDDTVMKWAIAWQMRSVKRARPSIMML